MYVSDGLQSIDVSRHGQHRDRSNFTPVVVTSATGRADFVVAPRLRRDRLSMGIK
jgi:hypothetical protein